MTRDAEPGDDAWAVHGGKQSGFSVWQGRRDDGLPARLVDCRWLFGSDEHAARYQEARTDVASEGMQPIGPCRFGTQGRLFTGLLDPVAGVAYQLYNLLFVVGPVAIKVYVAGLGIEEADELGRLAELRAIDWLQVRPGH